MNKLRRLISTNNRIREDFREQWPQNGISIIIPRYFVLPKQHHQYVDAENKKLCYNVVQILWGLQQWRVETAAAFVVNGTFFTLHLTSLLSHSFGQQKKDNL